MDSSVVLAVAACLFVICLLRWFSSRGNLPPGPTGLPFLGYTPFLSRMPHLDFQRLAKKYGDIFSIQMGSAYVVVFNDFESTKEAFAMDVFIGRPSEFPIELSKETLESGAFNGLPWKEQRRFSLHMLRDLGLGKSKMEGQLGEEIAELLEHLERNADKPFPINDVLASSMSNNISSLVFGKRFEYKDPTRQMLNRVTRSIGSAAGQAAWQLFFPRVKRIFKFLGIGDVDRVSKIQQELTDYIIKEIEEHEKTLNPSNIRDYIDGYLLEIKKRKGDPAFCKPVLKDMVIAFFGAGSETVRLSVEWLVLKAADNPDAQRHIQREIDEVIGLDQLPTWPHHKSMPYTHAFILELTRWRTTIPINIIRYTLADTKLGGYFIPKHSHILSNLWAIHHDPEYWGPDADDFRPERFLTEDGQEVKKWEHYIPFSIGKRACPGEPLAKIEIFLYFASILQRFNIRFPDGRVPDFEGELGVGLMPKSQELIFTRRN